MIAKCANTQASAQASAPANAQVLTDRQVCLVRISAKFN